MSARDNTSERPTISLRQLHAGQLAAYLALRPHRYMALRCGRRFGKTEFARTWIMDGLVRGEICAWFAPQNMTWAEVYTSVFRDLGLLVENAARNAGVIRFVDEARLDFWSLANAMPGRGRGYHRIVIDEAAFTEMGDRHTPGSMLHTWETAIKPTLLDYEGRALVCSNSAGKNPDNFFYAICTDPAYGFAEYHATTMDNPVLPKRRPRESDEAWAARRQAEMDSLEADNDPLVYAQEYLAEFVDWAGVAFFSREKLLEDGQPVPWPKLCDGVYAVIDTALKTGLEHDGTAVTYFASLSTGGQKRLVILDWDLVQVEGATLETWLPEVFRQLDHLAKVCGSRSGSLGAFIEDKNSGTVLLQQARRRGLRATAIESKLTAMGKDERAISVSGYVHRGLVKYSQPAFDKVVTYKRNTRNHLLDQVEGFQIGDKRANRADDLLDTFCYGIALALGDRKGF